MPNKNTNNQTNRDALIADLNHPIYPLQQEYAAAKAYFEAQPPMIQRFFEAQARQLVDAILRNQLEARFNLPDRVAMGSMLGGEVVLTTVPAEFREQMIGGVIDRLTRADMRSVFRQRLTELEESANPAVAACAGLLRYSIAIHMIYNLLPSGRTVTYRAVEGEEMPTIPIPSDDFESAITEATDAIVEEDLSEENRGELQVPFVPAARQFFLPQWVAFDTDGNILVNSVNDAEADLSSMQRFISILHMAVGLAAYIVADPEYQAKRYGMLGQLVHQGRALAAYEAKEMMRMIKQRAAAQDLNRGLSLSLPYFDDQSLDLRTHNFEVIPAGRIMFSAAFVVRAVREEQAKVAQDTRLSPSTRKYLLAELNLFENVFNAPGNTL